MTVLETDTRLRAARGVEKHEASATLTALKALARRNGMEHPPPLASDGHNGCAEAVVGIWGNVPQRKTKPGRPATKKRASPTWQHLKVVKKRQGKQVSPQLPKEVVFGEGDQVAKALGQGTVHVERAHLTMRHFNGGLARRGPGFSKKLVMHRAAIAWEDLYYNFGHIVRTLKVPIDDHKTVKERFKTKWLHRTPAMAAALTSNVWSVKELLCSIII